MMNAPELKQMPPSKLGPFVVQFLLVPPVVTTITLLLAGWLPIGEVCPWGALDLAVEIPVAVTCGAFAAKWKPLIVLPTGLWTWLIPPAFVSSLTLLSLILDGPVALRALALQRDWLPDLPDLCNSVSIGERFFVWYPCIAWIGYSMGVGLGRRLAAKI